MPERRLAASSLGLLLVASAVSLSSASSSEFHRYRVPCPKTSLTDLTVLGYTSILDLNAEMRHHASLLAPPWNESPKSEYRYTLCPHVDVTSTMTTTTTTTPSYFEGSQQLTPLLDRTYIKCGETGDSGNNACVIQGGMTQVLLIDDSGDEIDNDTAGSSTSSSSSSRLFVFQGITFLESQDMSIAALASSSTRAEFIDCHWKVRTVQ
jgi:hypothetical protein